MRYTVKQLGKLAGVTPRTLHYYDEIGLLQPANHGDNGYRYYGEEAVLRLQQILLYREMDFSLEQIRTILDRPDFDLLEALQEHRKALLGKVNRLTSLIETVDKTMKHIRGEIEMQDHDYYHGFDEEQQKEYAREAERRWGDSAAQSQKRWNRMSREQKNTFLGRMHEVSDNLARSMDHGPESPEAQEGIDRWYRLVNEECFTCSLEVFENLGHMYTADPAFTATYENIRPGMAAFMEAAMTFYVQNHRAG
ncbi:MAG TPA: MerR family transcriptional regulator [Anaerolineaceae bacterium]|nr:MerR family transcriptional regulator [Anaerolineaceae bacterium]